MPEALRLMRQPEMKLDLNAKVPMSMGAWVNKTECSLCGSPKAAETESIKDLAEEVRALREDLQALHSPHPMAAKPGELERLMAQWNAKR